jgi:MFS family permease
MGIACLGMGLLPTYAEVGILATILLVLYRLLQGLSLGGEIGSAAVFMLEHAPSTRRCFYVGMLSSVWVIGPGLAIATLYINAIILGPAIVEAWGWRVPFLVGAALVIIGIIMRLWVEETPVFKQIKSRGEIVKNPIVVSFRKVWKQVLIVISFYLFGGYIYYLITVAAWSFIWLTLLEIPLATAAPAFIIIFSVCTILAWIGGYLGDKYGRKQFVVWSYLLIGILLIPLYSLLFMTKDIIILTILTLIPLALQFFAIGPVWTILQEVIPSNVRVAGFSIGYQIGIAITGFAPAITAYIFSITGSIVWTTSYIAAFGLILALIAWLWFPETKGIDIYRTVKV